MCWSVASGQLGNRLITKERTLIDREPMRLRVEKDEKGVGLWLDEKRLRLVSEYKIESMQKGNHAELSIKMLVQYPVIQGNNP